MTYFSCNHRSTLSNFLAKGTLTALIAFMSVSCSSSADAGTPSASSENQGAEVVAIASNPAIDSPEERNARREWMADRTDDGTPRSLSVTTKDIEAGSPYSDARTAFANRGWMPHTQATTGPEYDWNNATLEEMRSLGYPEFYDCVGDICSAQFVYEDRTMENGSILTVSADITSDMWNGVPIITDWAIEDTADKTYVQRNFSADLFSQIQEEQSFCISVGQCGRDRYILKDALLLSGSYGFGSTKISLIPKAAVSQATALAYAKALDTNSIIDFESSRFRDEASAEVYEEAGLPSQNIAETRGGLTQVTLFQTDGGKVSEILLENIVF